MERHCNHWTAVRNWLMNAHADLFPRLPAITRMLDKSCAHPTTSRHKTLRPTEHLASKRSNA